MLFIFQARQAKGLTELLDGEDLGSREEYVAKKVVEYNFSIPDESLDDWNSFLQKEFQSKLDAEEDEILLNK